MALGVDTAQAILKLGGDPTGAMSAIKKVETGMVGMGNVGGRVFKTLAKLTAIATGGFLALSTASYLMYQKQKRGISELDASLRRVGRTYKANEILIEGTIRKFEKLSAVGDDELRQMLASLVNITQDYTASLELLPVALDLATNPMIENATAVRLLGMAYRGQTDLLRRYGIMVDQTASKEEQFQQIIRQATGGLRAGTLAGQMGLERPLQRIRNELGNIMKQWGEQVAAVLDPLFNKKVIPFLQRITDVGIKNFAKIFTSDETKAAMMDFLTQFAQGLAVIADAFWDAFWELSKQQGKRAIVGISEAVNRGFAALNLKTAQATGIGAFERAAQSNLQRAQFLSSYRGAMPTMQEMIPGMVSGISGAMQRGGGMMTSGAGGLFGAVGGQINAVVEANAGQMRQAQLAQSFGQNQAALERAYAAAMSQAAAENYSRAAHSQAMYQFGLDASNIMGMDMSLEERNQLAAGIQRNFAARTQADEDRRREIQSRSLHRHKSTQLGYAAATGL